MRVPALLMNSPVGQSGTQKALELQAVLHRPALAELLGMTPRALQFFLYRLQPAHRYRTFTIAKRAGGVRTIRAPIVPCVFRTDSSSCSDVTRAAIPTHLSADSGALEHRFRRT